MYGSTGYDIAITIDIVLENVLKVNYKGFIFNWIVVLLLITDGLFVLCLKITAGVSDGKEQISLSTEQFVSLVIEE